MCVRGIWRSNSCRRRSRKEASKQGKTFPLFPFAIFKKIMLTLRQPMPSGPHKWAEPRAWSLQDLRIPFHAPGQRGKHHGCARRGGRVLFVLVFFCVIWFCGQHVRLKSVLSGVLSYCRSRPRFHCWVIVYCAGSVTSRLNSWMWTLRSASRLFY